MSRPKCQRRISDRASHHYFKPQGIPMGKLAEVQMTEDELEAIKLAHLERLYQQEASEAMGISRQTFGRILESAHQKLAEALVLGKAIKIDGGNTIMADKRKFQCRDCEHIWEEPCGTGHPPQCPECESQNFGRYFESDKERAEHESGRCRRRQGGQGRNRQCRHQAKV